MNLQQYLNKEFNQLDIMIDSFMAYPLSLHVTLEKELYQLEEDTDKLNKCYFDNVYKNAITLFEGLFHEEDDIFLVSQIRSERPLTYKTGIYEKYVKSPNMFKLQYKKVDLIDEQEQMVQYSLLCKKEQIRYKSLIKAICNQDFQILKPRLKDRNTYYPEIIFINANRNRIVNIYDDRGGFVLSNTTQDYKFIKNEYGNLLDSK